MCICLDISCITFCGLVVILIFIPILINGLADGLAEPVGITFGKHKYKTRACLSTRKYERSYEGSLCVFIVSTIIIAAYYEYISLEQYLLISFISLKI